MSVDLRIKHWSCSFVSVCQFYGFSGGAFGLVSINTLAAISIDRYHVIVRSVNQKNRLTYKVIRDE